MEKVNENLKVKNKKNEKEPVEGKLRMNQV